MSRDCQTTENEVFFLPCTLSISLSLWAFHCFISYTIGDSSLVRGKCLNLTGRSFDKLRQQRTCLPPAPNIVCRDPFVRNLIIFYALTSAGQQHHHYTTATDIFPLYIHRARRHTLFIYIYTWVFTISRLRPDTSTLSLFPSHSFTSSLYRYL